MVDQHGKTAFASLAPLHEGLPEWFPKVVNYVLCYLKGRNRFNLYNTCRALAAGPHPRLRTPQLRDTLQRFAGQGLRFTGSHGQKVILDKQLVLFWSRFLIPACETLPHDLSTFNATLQTWRFEDLTSNPIIKQLLLPSYRSFTKEHVTRYCLQTLFSKPERYQEFVDWQVSQLSPEGFDLYTSLLQHPQPAHDTIYSNIQWATVYDLWNVLLIHPAYIIRDGKIFLQLGTFKGFETPFQLSPLAAKQIIIPDSSLEPIRFITSQMLHGHTSPFSANNLRRSFADRQLDLFRESAKDIIVEIKQVLKWWHDAIGPGCILREELPSTGCILTRSITGRFVPFISKQQHFKLILKTSLKFGLLANVDKNSLTLTRLGQMFITGERPPDLYVKTTWARNVNRLSLRLGKGWSAGFCRLLEVLATCGENGTYEVTPDSLSKSGMETDLAMLIIGGFIRLDTPRLERLRSWAAET